MASHNKNDNSGCDTNRENERQMNTRISNLSSTLCDKAAGSTPAPLFHNSGTVAGTCETHAKMTTYPAKKQMHKRIMMLIALCLAFATAVPVMVLAAS
jgi:hypothetical protein